MNGPPSGEVPRTIHPRKPKSDYRIVVALTPDAALIEKVGQMPLAELTDTLESLPPAILVAQGFGQHLQRFQRKYGSDPQFNFRVTPIHRYSRPWSDGTKRDQGMIVDTICNFVGWKTERKQAHRYHYPLDPIWFLTAGIDDLRDSGDSRIVKLFDWAIEIRDWCQENQLQIKASAGGLAAQLLRDPRFYPEPRRKCPRLINQIARPNLPGNYYRLHAPTHVPLSAIHLDMENAHHFWARLIKFPHVDTLHAYGDWSHTARSVECKRSAKPWRPGSTKILERPGMFHVRLEVPHIPKQFFPPPYMETMGVHDVYIYSNEIDWIRELGGNIRAVHSAYVSETCEQGLNHYAKFALEQIRKHRDWKPWLKPTLHSTYGLLAARPVPFATGYFRAKGGTVEDLPMGNATITARVLRRKHEVESRIVNVIHRGMIEAHVRKESLQMARFLTESGRHRVLAIYADALFIEHNAKPIGLLDPPWRVTGYIDHLRFLSPVHFVSPSINRLPGIPRTARERYLELRKLRDEREAAATPT